MKQNYKEIINTTVVVTNEADVNRTCDITANVHITLGALNSIREGRITREDVTLAEFNRWGDGTVSYTMFIHDGEERKTMQAEIEAFIAGVAALVMEKPITI